MTCRPRIGLTVKNRFGAELDQLDEADKAVLSEYNALCASLEADDVWDGFDLQDKTVLAMAGDWGESYLINPVEPVDSIFAAAMALSDDWNISVYRISLAAPDLLAFRFEGNFNTIGETYSLFGNQLYFVKYDRRTSVSQQWTSDHFATFLAHEAFHYYMQDNWPDGGRFSTESLTEADIALLGEEYEVLAQI